MAGPGLLLSLFSVILLSLPGPGISEVCRDQEGNEVDWWIVYKLPRRTSVKYRHKYKKHFPRKKDWKGFNNNLKEGVAYAYLTSALPDTQWTMSPVAISDPSSIPGRTLAPLYSSSSADMFSLLYNDEVPNGPTSFYHGHTKGVVMGSQDSSLWLIHSVPHFPPFPNETYDYPATGHSFGQSALCLSFSSGQLDTVGKQLTYNYPNIYHTNVPQWSTRYTSLVAASQGSHINTAPYFNTEILNTLAGESLTVFAKFTDFGKDLYADLVAPSLQVPLMVESWPRGPGKMPSRCETKFIVENINEMDFTELEDDDFRTTFDHAKWAISLDKKRPWVCVGDINRMTTQEHRAGGTACFWSYTVWKTFKKSVKDIEACDV